MEGPGYKPSGTVFCHPREYRKSVFGKGRTPVLGRVSHPANHESPGNELQGSKIFRREHAGLRCVAMPS